MIRPIIHMVLHVIVPGVVARLGFSNIWKKAWLIMILVNIIDLDHLLANPIYDPNRCSIGFHPLHSYFAIAGYLLIAAFPKTRIIGVGLLIHMALDGADCWLM